MQISVLRFRTLPAPIRMSNQRQAHMRWLQIQFIRILLTQNTPSTTFAVGTKCPWRMAASHLDWHFHRVPALHFAHTHNIGIDTAFDTINNHIFQLARTECRPVAIISASFSNVECHRSLWVRGNLCCVRSAIHTQSCKRYKLNSKESSRHIHIRRTEITMAANGRAARGKRMNSCSFFHFSIVWCATSDYYVRECECVASTFTLQYNQIENWIIRLDDAT